MHDTEWQKRWSSETGGFLSNPCQKALHGTVIEIKRGRFLPPFLVDLDTPCMPCLSRSPRMSAFSNSCDLSKRPMLQGTDFGTLNVKPMSSPWFNIPQKSSWTVKFGKSNPCFGVQNPFFEQSWSEQIFKTSPNPLGWPRQRWLRGGWGIEVGWLIEGIPPVSN